jgi:hypothetical protein
MAATHNCKFSLYLLQKSWSQPTKAIEFTPIPVDEASEHFQSVVSKEFQPAEDFGEDAFNVALASTAAVSLLASIHYRELRSCVCLIQSDLKRFRNFVVHTVMATDIADKELNGKRKERWRQCFDEWTDDPTGGDVQRKAIIVIEHLIQATDSAHTMQPFEVYKKWNERLFYEVYSAVDSGRAESDPSEKWYEGEIGFDDSCIIPLEKKLGACRIFGVASDEYLNYAQENRQKWTNEGKALVAFMVITVSREKA